MIPVETLRKLVRYEPETGKLYWLERTPDSFADNVQVAHHVCSRWNSRYAGSEAFTAPDSNGYPSGAIFDVKYRAHRVIWAITYGDWPTGHIDHINGIKCDNRLSNLREVSIAANSRNLPRFSSNTSGVTGVAWDKSNARWRAFIQVSGRHISLGRFDDFDVAVKARKAAEKRYGFHPNHGRSPISEDQA